MSVEGGGGGDGDGEGGGEMTLAFSLSAVERLADPAAAFDDARAWSRHVGVVDNDVDAVESALAEYGLRERQDFDPDWGDVWLALEGIRESTHTPRHVYVGESAEDRRVATRLGWEFVSVEEAAEKAGWALADSDDASESGVVARLSRALSSLWERT